MIYGIGTNIIEIIRIKKAVEKNQKLLNRIFTEQELDYYKNKKLNIKSIAGGFAAKEAVLKAIGTGLGSFRWKDVEILRCSIGKPIVRLKSKVKEFAEENGIGTIYVTISHSKEYATATALAEISIEREGIVIEDLLFQANEENRRNIH